MPPAIALSDKERKILFALSLNGRTSLSRVAEELGLSRQLVGYIVTALEKKGVIEGYYAILDIPRLGFFYHRAFLKLRNTHRGREGEIIRFCSRHKKVGWVIQHHGGWDLAVIIWAKTPLEFEDVLDGILEKYGDCIDRKWTSISTRIYHLKHAYLLGQSSREALILGQNPSPFEVDDTDMDILGELAKDARKSYVDIGRALSPRLQPGAVKNRIERLQEGRVILGYSIKMNRMLLGLTHTKVFLFLNINARKNVSHLIRHLMDTVGVVYITRAVGIADLEFEIYTSSTDQFFDVMKKMRLAFPNLIRDFTSSIIHYEPYINYLPLKK